jgi:hypothetical protein
MKVQGRNAAKRHCADTRLHGPIVDVLGGRLGANALRTIMPYAGRDR